VRRPFFAVLLATAAPVDLWPASKGMVSTGLPYDQVSILAVVNARILAYLSESLFVFMDG